MRHIYSLMMYLLTPFLIARLWWKGKRLPAYRERIAERFCWDNPPHVTYDVWVHAVSLGEVIAAIPLIEQLLIHQRKLLITTMTPTGAERVKQQFNQRVTHRYIPYDMPSVLKRFFKANRIRIGLVVETELWPNLLHQATRFNIPLFLINARLSERSFQGYKKVKWFFEPLLNLFQVIFTQSRDDAQRFINLGAASDKVIVRGNIKFDLNTRSVDLLLFNQLKELWGADRTTLIIASTHENEEQQILSRLSELRKSIPDLVVLIAPRHPERFQKIYQLSQQMGFNTGLRSQISTLKRENEVIVLDSLGELLGFYKVSDYAFVGGSLVPVGGHNVLEPIAMGIPVLSGNQVHNFKAICSGLKEADAIELVNNAEELVSKVAELHANPERKITLVENATRILEANKGVVELYLKQIESYLEGRAG